MFVPGTDGSVTTPEGIAVYQTIEEYQAVAHVVLSMLDPGPKPRIVGNTRLHTHWELAQRRYAQAYRLLMGKPMDGGSADGPDYQWRQWSDWVTVWESQFSGMHRARVVEVGSGLYAAYVDHVYHDSYDDLDEAKAAIRAFVETLTGLHE